MIILSLILVVINLLLFINFEYFKKLVNIYDFPDKKLKKHKKKTPILGGLILAINFFIILIYQFFFSEYFLFVSKNFTEKNEYLSILILIFGLFFLGLYDDKNKLAPHFKLFYSSIVILISLLLNEKILIEMFSLSFYEKKIFLENNSLIFSIFCILILLNAINFYDGINGQSCLFFIFVFLYLFYKSEFNNFYLISILLLILILFLNLKNELFLGDSGIFLLTTIISLSLIYEHNENKNILYADEIFLVLILPGIDLIRLTFTRVFNKKNAFYGDRNHIHHLLNKKISLALTNTVLILLCCFPIILFLKLEIIFNIVFLIFLLIYVLLIYILKFND